MNIETEPMPTVLEAARRIRTGEVTSTELTERCLAAISAGDDKLNAWVHVDAEGALAAARKVDDAVARGDAATLGPLAGVPFGVKDLEDCIGMPTTQGARWFADGPLATEDFIHVARLRAAGGVPVGKTATPEFGAWAYTASPLLGVTRNPWETRRTPGGSSGGTAAAVSSGMIPFGTASDGGGSIRTPAAFTGLVGLRASYGRIPTFGDSHLAQNAVVGCLTTTVADTAFLLDIMAGPDPRDRTCLAAPDVSYEEAIGRDYGTMKVAWSADFGFGVVDPEVQSIAHEAALACIKANDADHVDRPFTLGDYSLIYATMGMADKFVGFDRQLWETRSDELDPLVAPSWAGFAKQTMPDFAKVEDARRKLVVEVAGMLDGVDLLLSPMASMPAFGAEGPMPTEVAGKTTHPGMSVALAFLANLVNLPAISVPAGVTKDSLPVGLQIIGPRHREDLVLAAAARYEAARPWPRHAPA